MAERVKVEVFGIRNQSCRGVCSCTCGCSQGKTMGEMYEDLYQVLSGSNLRNHIDIRFIDILMDNMDEHENVLKALDHGYSLPITAINGRLKYHGSIDNRRVYEAIRRSA